ncbi:MAG: hypothetical protein KBI10_02675 [Syntrophorhabdales bacterium]|nr:hypothetical protein [Syntrophorhabdales bacterium]
MDSTAKVLFLKKLNGVSYKTIERDEIPNEVSACTEQQRQWQEGIGDKAMKVLKEIEEIWERDHNNVELRDRFHLLRYYLERSFS